MPRTTTDFFELFERTREIDPATGKVESLRRWSRRCGIDVNVLIGTSHPFHETVSNSVKLCGSLNKVCPRMCPREYAQFDNFDISYIKRLRKA